MKLSRCWGELCQGDIGFVSQQRPVQTNRTHIQQWALINMTGEQWETAVHYCKTLYNTVHHYKTLFTTVKHCTTLYTTVKHYKTRYTTVKHCKTLYTTVRHGKIWSYLVFWQYRERRRWANCVCVCRTMTVSQGRGENHITFLCLLVLFATTTEQ